LWINHPALATILDAKIDHHANDADEKDKRNPEDRHVQIIDFSREG